MEEQFIIKAEETKPTLKPIKEGSRLDRFLTNYLTNGKNGSLAVKESGYKTKQPQKTAYQILKREGIKAHLRIREEALKAVLIKDRPQFLLELRDFKHRCRLASKLSEEGKAMALEASILGISTPEHQQQINVFGTLDRVNAMFEPVIVDDKAKEGVVVDTTPTTNSV